MIERGMRQTILVAGGAGFVGSHLCEKLLLEGHRVLCLDSLLTGTMANVAPLVGHPDFQFIRQDVSKPFHVAEEITRVYNLACAASPPLYQADPVHTMMTNVVGTEALLRLAAMKGARLLQASTSEVYGDPECHPQDEAYFGHVNCTGVRACYDEGKRAAETLCFDYRRAGRADVRVARIFNTYGPRMRPDDGRIVSNMIVQALAGAEMTVYGDGTQTRSFCFVSDLVEGLVALMEVEPAPETPVNLGNPEEFTINEIARIIHAALPGRSRIVHLDGLEDDPRRRRPDIARARELLGWVPRVMLAEGMPRTIRWFAEEAAPGAAPDRLAAGRGA
ncbi:UDP-glucuronic acid decarboxylase family protein [Amaricoccus solimangrovi]|uniref:SDR family oxidoreductase n=1 Tax=Amaricoccus solimangrovi TaxID=2589815 RepID=A0A501WU31_9RHOB|nr:UDP-glucuronic acid decarboxylase family protein [Amaricoccus solimangrovi]TPE51654.1 SDR family oxidoreductase [Amaricoccus solimangrovi]